MNHRLKALKARLQHCKYYGMTSCLVSLKVTLDIFTLTKQKKNKKTNTSFQLIKISSILRKKLSILRKIDVKTSILRKFPAASDVKIKIFSEPRVIT